MADEEIEFLDPAPINKLIDMWQILNDIRPNYYSSLGVPEHILYGNEPPKGDDAT